MSEIVPSGEVVNGGHIVKAVCDTMSVYNVPITSRARAIIGKQAKELLADGFDPETVLAASVIALRRGQPQVAHFVAQDIVLAQAGQHLSRQEYEQEIVRAKASLDPVRKRQREMMEAALKERDGTN